MEGGGWERALLAALAPFGYPCAWLRYDGEARAYFVFSARYFPVDFGDDAPGHERVKVGLHFFAPVTMNTRVLRARVKLALLEAGFTYPAEVDAGDDAGQHVVFEFEGVQGIGGEDDGP